MDLRETRSWLRLHTIVDELRNERTVAALERQHARALHQLQPHIDPNAYQQLTDLLGRLESGIDQIERPWLQVKTATGEVKALEDKWEQLYGKMSDPAMKAKIEEACRKLQSRPRATLGRSSM